MNLFELFVKIGVDDSKFKEGIGEAKSGFGEFTSWTVAKGNLIASAITAAAKALVDFGKRAVEAYAQYEQLVGGIETLFKSSSDKLQDYARNAYKTAGMSANDYMKTATSFASSLLQSFTALSQEEIDKIEDALKAQTEAIDEEYKRRIDAMEDAHDAETEETEKANEKRLRAIEKANDAEIESFEKLTEQKIKLIDEQYTESIKLVDEEKYRQLKAIDDQIDALNDQTKAEREAIKKREDEQKKALLEEKVANAKTGKEREEAEQDLADFLADLAQEEREARRDAQIDALKDEKESIKERADAQKEALKEQRDSEIEAVEETSEIRLKKLRESHRAELEAAREANAEKLKELKRAHEEELEELKRQLEKKREQEKIEAEMEAERARQSGSTFEYTAEQYELAADMTNKAITDMSDNANKLGTDMQLIQNAYQGFSKSNYTMLDNLRLGYGGTKTEMERLVADAAKLSDTVDAQSLSFANVVEAIHVVQTELGISGISMEEYSHLVSSGAMTQEEAFDLLGTTAKESFSTIEGSVNTAKAAWTNMVTGLGDSNADAGVLMGEFLATFDTAAQNIIPIASNIIQNFISGIGKGSKQIAKTGVNIIISLADSLVDAIPELIEAVPEIIVSLCDEIVYNLPKIIEVGLKIPVAVAEGIIQAIPQLLLAIPQLISSLIEGIGDYLVDFFYIGEDMVGSVKDGFMKRVDEAKNWGKDLIQNFIDGILEKWNSLKTTVSNVAQSIKDLIGFSEPKEGPLSNFHTYAPDMMDLFIKGIKDNEKKLRDQIEETFNFGEKTIDANVSYGSNGETNDRRNVSIVQNIYSEAKTAADLMQEALYQQERAVFLGV